MNDDKIVSTLQLTIIAMVNVPVIEEVETDIDVEDAVGIVLHLKSKLFQPSVFSNNTSMLTYAVLLIFFIISGLKTRTQKK